MLALLVLTLIACASAQSPGCDFSQNVTAGTVYALNSPRYPASYSPNIQCRWQAKCPAGYQCRLDCLLEMPSTTGCSGDRFLVSRIGDPQVNNAEYYCGYGRLPVILSENQNLAVAVLVPSNSPGGRFSCNLTAQAATPPAQPCRCGYRKQNRIVGGTSTGVNEYTMMAAITGRNSQTGAGDGRVMCGAVIISSMHVLTAAHCLDNQTPARLLVNIGNSKISLGQNYTISRFSIHPSYNSQTLSDDIAILWLQVAIQFNDNLSPVCLPFKYQNVDITGRNVTILGWGTLYPGGPLSETLQQVQVGVISQQQCQKTETITYRQMCTLTPGKDGCQNDSGGPCLYTDPSTGLLFQLGIVSYGRFCASATTPAVHTRVTAYIDWITNTAPANYCVKQ